MKKIKMNESSYNKLVNEVSYGTVNNAYLRSDELFYRLKSQFDDFYTELNDSLYKSRFGGNDENENPYLLKIKEYSDAIYDILNKKANQFDRFSDELSNVNSREFFNGEDRYNDIEDYEMRYLKDKYGN